ncbi:MAG: hypothetical protein IKO27_08810 [Ruminococcus sp.]|nr:hypothetical protein [Ruminococcus sp.]
MDIGISGGRIRLRFSGKELREAGLSFESFGGDGSHTESFLAAVLALLKKKGYLRRNADLLDIEASEEEDGLTLFICERRRGGVTVKLFRSPKELDTVLNSLCCGSEPDCELWKYSDGYALIAKGCSFPENGEELILAAKIREYGEKLSDSPFRLI